MSSARASQSVVLRVAGSALVALALASPAGAQPAEQRIVTPEAAAAHNARLAAAGDHGTVSRLRRLPGLHDVSAPLRLMKMARQRAVIRRVLDPQASLDPTMSDELPGPIFDGALSSKVDNLGPAAPAALATFEGIGRGLTNYTVSGAPPDTVGAVGKDYFVQAVNSDFAVFQKSTGAPAFGPFPIVNLFQGFPTTDGNKCAINNDGDPIVFYDQLADRWLISQFDVSGYNTGRTTLFQCLAVSTSSDPLGSWYRWDYATPANLFGDYEKIGLWPDGYYMTIRGFGPLPGGSFAGSRLLVFDRSALLAGNPNATQLDSGYLTYAGYGSPPEDGFTPMSLDGFGLPPVGAPGAVMKKLSQGASPGFFFLYLAKVNSNADGTWPVSPTLTITPGTSNPILIQVNAFTSASGAQVPQPTTTTKLDTLGNNLMYRLAYRNYGTQAAPNEHLVVNHTVSLGATQVALRWYELTHSGGLMSSGNPPAIAKQETFAPDTASRWMGSIAMDKRQNIGIGYNLSSTTTHPSIAFSGLIPANAGLQGETIAQAGNDYQTIDGTSNGNTDLIRWGDYSQLSVDPVDDCTFWYTTEYLKNDGAGDTHNFDWHTAFTSFRHPDCAACTAPATPTGVTVTANSTTSYTVNWASSANAGSYGVFRSLAACPGGNPVKIATVSAPTTSYTDNTAVAGTTYYYSVTAIDSATANCESIRSTCVSGAIGSCAQAPSFAGVDTVDTTAACAAHVSWRPATSNCPDNPGVSYNVYRSTVTPFTPAAGNRIAKCLTGTSFDDAGLSGGPFYYTVHAEDSSAGGAGACNGGNEDVNTVRQSTTPTTRTTLYFENFDALAAGGVATNWSASVGGWVGARACAPTESGANTLHWGNAACNGKYLQSGSLTTDDTSSPTITIPAGNTGARLSFWHRFDYYGQNTLRDGGKIRVSVNGAAPIEVPGAAFVSGGYTGNRVNEGCSATYVGTGIWSNTQYNMMNTVIDLDQVCGGGTCAGKTVRFTFTGISNCDNGLGKGWFIDDVNVSSIASPAPTCAAVPAPFQVLAVTSKSAQNILEWLFPASSGGQPYDIRFRTDRYPVSVSDGTSATSGTVTASGKGSFTHAVTNGTTYYYAAYVTNASGASTAVVAKGKPFAPAGTGVQWTYTTGAAALSPAGGNVAAVSNDRFVHNLLPGTAATGGTWPGTWTPLRLNNPVQNRPRVVPFTITSPATTNVMFVAAQDGKVHAINADTGALAWSSAALGTIVQAGVSGTLKQYGQTYDVLMVGTRNAAAANSLVGLAPKAVGATVNGGTLWTFDNGGGATGIGVINGDASIDSVSNRVYFTSRKRAGGSAGTVWCVNFTDTLNATPTLCNGGVGWPVALGDIDGSPVLANGALYVGTNAGVVYALNPLTGATIWSKDLLDGPIKGYVWPVFFSNVFYVATTNKVFKLTYPGGVTANVTWTANVAGASIPFLSTSGAKLYVGSTDGKLHQLDTATGADSALTLGAGTSAVGSPSVDAAATPLLDVGADDGTIYSIAIPYP
jgi:fibronectin type 3 domain-containing protein